MSEKSKDLEQEVESVRRAFYNTFERRAEVAQPMGEDFWVRTVRDDGVIVQNGEKFYLAPYSKDESGNIQFAGRDTWQEVKQEYTPVKNTLKAVAETDEELRVANYIVLYGDEKTRDLEGIGSDQVNPDGTIGEFFTEETQLDSPYTKTGMIYVDWEHGGDPDPEAPKHHDVLGYVDMKTLKRDAKGAWVERVLDRRNKYVSMLETLVKEGLIGTSSQAVPGQVEKGKNGHIKKWPLMRDTLTVSPMEPRMMSDNVIQALKGLAELKPELKRLLPEGAGDAPAKAKETKEPAEVKAQTNLQISNKEKSKMADETITKEQADEILRENAEIKGKLDKLSDDTVKAVMEALQKAPKLKDAGYVAPDSEDDHPEAKSFGDFLLAVHNKNTVRLKKVYETKALKEEGGESGGYLVPDQFVNKLLEVAGEGQVFGDATFNLPMTGRTASIPALDQTGTTAGQSAFLGGVTAGWTEESGTLSEKDVDFKMVELTAHKLGGYTVASRELNADSAIGLEALLTRLFGLAIGWHREYAFLRGDGLGKPLGVLNAACTIAVTRASSGNAFDFADVGGLLMKLLSNSWDRMRWLMHQTLIPSILDLKNSGSDAVFMHNIANKPVWTLLGAPIKFTEKLPAAGTAGDCLLVDPYYYIVGNRGGIAIASSEHYRFVNDDITWKFTDRVDGQPWMSTYITLADGSATVSPFVKLS